MADDIDRLASAVVHRFAASQSAARLAQPSPSPAEPTIIDRLASAVGQRLAIGSQHPNIETLASAVAKRLAASKGAARLASAATLRYALAGDVQQVASNALKNLQKP